MNLLDELALKYGTDKYGKHNYTKVYYDLFKDKRNDIKKVLEIGSAEGAGLQMFRDFFPNAEIIGAEIEENRQMRGHRFHTIKCDQAKLSDLNKILRVEGSDFDIVIDDGSHKPEDQIFTCKTLMPGLSENVVYIIEDVADESVFKYLDSVEVISCNIIRVGKRYDDQLIIVRHKQ